MFKTKLLFGAAAVLTAGCGVLLAAGPAAAKDVTVVAQMENDVPVARVSFADLDLVHRAGQKTLNRRVASAVRTVCAPSYEGTDTSRYTQCQNAAWDDAKPQIAAVVARAERLASGNATAQDRALALNTTIRFGAQ
ncbi:UrcA family protein [Sphingomonas sp. KRR8]|uniref:UrcA family protein n=1 Tax=Sphingomonas sp. KRR8 TaxID=2942996 RepID=UPI002020DE2F|nr:UrcA family protein [Sphingomonas sp. KRR8]URD59689.1 UrcA family protein [Sphingomonas sp. KRR8]